jgi:cobalt-zinc-cadmium efflux system outer membrane protein
MRDAGRSPNPALSLDLENVGGDAQSELREATAALAQQLELGGDRGARAQVAKAAEGLAWAELTFEEREVLGEAAERFLETWALQERASRLAASERLAERSVTAAGERFRAGAGPELEQTRAEGVAALRHSEWLRARADLTASGQRLAASWGSTEVRFDSLTLAPPRSEKLPTPARLEVLLADHPLSARAAAEVALEDARLREARAARVPDLDLSAGVRRLGAGDASTFIVGASIPLPLWNRQAGAVAAAQAEQQAAQARGELIGLDLRALLRSTYERYLANQASYELIATRVKPKSEDVLRQLTSGYRSGRFSSFEYLEGQRNLLEAELQLVEATAEAWRARLALERLLGRTIDDLSKEAGQ